MLLFCSLLERHSNKLLWQSEESAYLWPVFKKKKGELFLKLLDQIEFQFITSFLLPLSIFQTFLKAMENVLEGI